MTREQISLIPLLDIKPHSSVFVYPEAELSLLRKLQHVTPLPVQRAESLLEIAQLVWGHFTETHDT